MKEIPLTQGKVALVDDEDFEYLSQWKWYAHKVYLTYYAMRATYSKGKQTILLMHRVIIKPDRNLVVDHIDHDGLNNQKKNLLATTHRKNTLNRRKINSTGYFGVAVINNKYFVAQIQINGENKRLGTFKTAKEAHNKYIEVYNTLNEPI